MKKHKDLRSKNDEGIFMKKTSEMKVLLTGSLIISLNVLVMYGVSLYWLSPNLHIYITGKPLL